jgi:hypothetical protein
VLNELIAELGARYGEKLAGFWFDGFYKEPASVYLNMNNTYNISDFANAAKKGNPYRIIAYNTGWGAPFCKSTPYSDYSAGEEPNLDSIPSLGRFTDGDCQKMMWGPLGGKGWGCPGTSKETDFVVNRTDTLNSLGAVMILDTRVSIFGVLDPKQVVQLLEVKKRVSRNQYIASVKLVADNKVLNPLRNPEAVAHLKVKAYNASNNEIDLIKHKATVSWSSSNLYTSGNADVVSIDRSTGVVKPLNGGVARISATVEEDNFSWNAETNITVAPFYRDYHQSMVMKLFLCGTKGEVKYTFEQALEVIRKVDNLTRDIPKIIYLVGWQYDGHDTGYPSFAKVNERLKRPQDAKTEQSLIWLMEAAKKYHTTVSLHINMLDIRQSSPLWNEYADKDLIAKNADGTLKAYVWGYPISYTAEWNAGLSQRRINELLNLLPNLVEGGTIHIDAFHTLIPKYENEPISPYHAKKYGYTTEMEEQTQRKIFNYFREKGLDVTSEFVNRFRREGFIGLQPMAWHFSMKLDEYLNIPASLYCGGDGGSAIFGQNMLGEDIMTPDNPELNHFSRNFALQTLPFYFLNRFDRLTSDGSNAVFSENVQSLYSGQKITQGDVVLRDGDDVLFPALWKEGLVELYVYSRNGYVGRQWLLPGTFKQVTQADIYRITINGLELKNHNVAIENNKLTLTLDADDAMIIVPSQKEIL